MSIEQKISDLTAAINALTTVLNQRAGTTTVPQVAPGVPVMQAPQAPQAPQVQMPPPPSFAPPAQPQFTMPAAAPAAPFADQAGLIAYVMGAYKEMGAQKGAQIQNVLTGIGVQNINDVKPEQYGALYQGIEALKRG